MRKLKSCLLSILALTLLFATTTNAWWMPPKISLYDFIDNHLKLYKNSYIITRVWVDETAIIVFIDRNRDGVEDEAHIDSVYFYKDDGTPVRLCEGSRRPDEIIEIIERYMRRHYV